MFFVRVAISSTRRQFEDSFDRTLQIIGISQRNAPIHSSLISFSRSKPSEVRQIRGIAGGATDSGEDHRGRG